MENCKIPVDMPGLVVRVINIRMLKNYEYLLSTMNDEQKYALLKSETVCAAVLFQMVRNRRTEIWNMHCTIKELGTEKDENAWLHELLRFNDKYYDRYNLDALKYILESKRLNINRIENGPRLSGTALFYAKELRLIECLVQYSADINIRDKYGKTFFYYLQLSVFCTVLEKNYPIDWQLKDVEYCISLNPPILNLIITYPKVQHLLSTNPLLLQKFIQREPGAFAYFIDHTSDAWDIVQKLGITALTRSHLDNVFQEYAKHGKFLLKQEVFYFFTKAHSNQISRIVSHPLVLAFKHTEMEGKTLFTIAVQRGLAGQVIEALLTHDYSLGSQHNMLSFCANSLTPNGFRVIAKYLQKQNILITQEDLMQVVNLGCDFASNAMQLIQVFQLDKQPWFDTFVFKHIKEWLSNHRFPWISFLTHIAPHLDWKSILDTTDDQGNTIIHTLAKYRFNIGLVKLAIRLGIDGDAQNLHGDTAMHIACRSNLRNIARILLLLGCKTSS